MYRPSPRGYFRFCSVKVPTFGFFFFPRNAAVDFYANVRPKYDGRNETRVRPIVIRSVIGTLAANLRALTAGRYEVY